MWTAQAAAPGSTLAGAQEACAEAVQMTFTPMTQFAMPVCPYLPPPPPSPLLATVISQIVWKIPVHAAFYL